MPEQSDHGSERGLLGLVIPCYNEAGRIDLPVFSAFLDTAPFARLVFVDDGSTDGTRELLDGFAETHPQRVSVMTLPRNRGKAEAVRVGLNSALAGGAGVVGFWDADLATPLNAVFDLLSVLEANPQVDWVLGSRVRVLGRDIKRRPTRHYLGRVFATAASLVLAMPVYDTQCGAKLFRATPELHTILATPFISRWIFDVEMIARFDIVRGANAARPAEAAIHEYPLARWVDVGESKIKGRHFLQASIDLLRIWRARGEARRTTTRARR